MAKILVIDDDEQIRAMLRQLLEKQGYEVFIASDGVEGLKLFRKESIDLIITDIIMPEKEGIETIRELVNEFPDVKIIAMSGGGRIGPEAYLRMAKGFGASHTFTKPIDLKELSEAVKKLIS